MPAMRKLNQEEIKKIEAESKLPCQHRMSADERRMCAESQRARFDRMQDKRAD